MDEKLIVQVRRLRDDGWLIPRHRLAFGRLPEGVFCLHEEWVPMFNRHVRVARLLDPATGVSVPDLPPLFDAVLLRAGADEWILAGVEHVTRGLQEVDVAQTWRIELLRIDPASCAIA